MDMLTVIRQTTDICVVFRKKQLEYGKNTPGYVAYLAAMPREQRSSTDPRTPEKLQKCSKRSWDGQVRKWRRQLHLWDPSATDAELASLSLAEPEADTDEDAQIGSADSSSSISFSDSPPRSRDCASVAVQLGVSIGAILSSSSAEL